jgi:hypothetical protein
MLKIKDNFRVKMWYNDGNTEINKNALFLSGAEYIAEQYSKNEKIDYKYYIIYHDITVKFLGITVAKRSYRLKEWGQYDEV